MKKRILAILLAIALLSSVAGVVAYAAGGTCPKCGASFATDTELDKHSSSCKGNQCSSCGKYFTDSAQYNSHVASCQGIQCANCKQYFVGESVYQEHVKTCGQEAVKYYCPYDCAYNIKKNDGKLYFATAEELEAHIASNHVENPNALHCPYKDKDGVKCTYIAYSISDYNNHIAANHQKDGEQVTPRDNIQRFFDKYFMGIGLNVNENSFSSVVRIFAYVTEVFMSVFTDSGASEVFQFAGDSGVTYFFETIVPHFWALFTE